MDALPRAGRQGTARGTSGAAPLLYARPDAAVMLGTCVPTLRRWISQRKLASVKLGRRICVERSEIDRLIAAHRRPAIE